MLRHDVVVVGAGLAGMRAAIEAKRAGADVAIISKLHPTRSHSGSAEGGINAALGNAAEDSPEMHTFDTVKGSDYLGDQDAIEIMCTEAPGDIYELEHMGAVFSRFADGRIAQRPFGAAGSPRTVYSADITGHVLIHVLYEQLLKYEVPVYEEFFALDLVVDGGRCVGVLAWDIVSGGVHGISAHNTILATGGVGRMYYGTTNAYACTGDGMSMAWRAGVPLKDMEFMQFHPTTLKSNGVLITEGCRGEGAYLRNSNGERFMAIAAPNAMELASRDVVSRAETREIEEGRGVDGCVLLDLTHLGAKKILTRLPGSRELAMDYAGVDPILEPIPVRPGAHYHMGGVDTDVDGRTILPGLYAAGRVRVRLGARRQPPGRQLAHGDDHVRPPRRQPRRRRRARRSQRRARARGGGARRRRPHPRDLRALRRRAALAGARGAGDVHVRRRRRLPHRRAPRSAAWPSSATCASAAATSWSTTPATASTPISSRCSSSRACSRWPTASSRAGSRARSRAARTRAWTTRSATTREWMKHTLAWCDGGKVRLDYKPVTVTRFEPMVRSY